jgi:hypothetical protein
MDDSQGQSAFMSALVTEHFVLQTAASATVTESAARTSLYVLALSSALVAIGVSSRSPELFVPFAAVVLAGVFLLGLFTVVRLVDTGLEYLQCLAGIARIRAYYRTLTPEAAQFFSVETGRWPEARSFAPLRFGSAVASLTTAASMIAYINGIVAGAGIVLVAGHLRAGPHVGIPLLLGVATAVFFIAIVLVYQRWRFNNARPRG